MSRYNPNIHHPQMTASKISDELLQAMGADEGSSTRSHHVRQALVAADKLLDELATLRRELAGAALQEAA